MWSQQVDLYVAVRRLVFGGGVETLFGPRVFQASEIGAGSGITSHGRHKWSEKELEEAFHEFEAGFEVREWNHEHGVMERKERPPIAVQLDADSQEHQLAVQRC
jgi:hypothetical protein